MSATAIQPRWLSVSDAAKYSSFCERHIRKLCSKGVVQSKNVKLEGASKGRRVIDRLSLDRFIEESESGPSELAVNQSKEGAR